ncbi:MAG: VanW family protein [Clostridioides sp.]|jgi:vancomycin resistance protein YoaR|nr:VanW family protein [Clostridioides sp.]
MNGGSTTAVVPAKSKNRRVLFFVGIVVVILLAIVLAFNKFFLYNGKIARNVTIEGVEISNMTKSDAYKAVSSKYTLRDINLSYDGRDYKVKAGDIGLKYDIEGAVNDAYDMTKKDTYLKNIKKYFAVLFEGDNLKFDTSFDEAKLSEKVSKIADGINVKMKNASISIDGGINYKDSVTGREFDVAANKESIYKRISNKNAQVLPLKVNLKKPEITLDQVKQVNSTLGSFSTDYGSSPDGRRYNVGLAARKASDIILMPGEEFSYNAYTGPSNRANGYKNAPVIVYGKIKQAPGGGVCQTSSTMYNAALFAGMQITEVNNHSQHSSYVPRGRDATVSDGGLNLRFKNPYDHPVFIKNYADGGTVSSVIYGNETDKKKVSINVKYGSGVYSTYRNFVDDAGNVVKSEHIANSTYKK